MSLSVQISITGPTHLSKESVPSPHVKAVSGHFKQSTEPGIELYSCRGHGVHDPALTVLLNVPFGHITHPFLISFKYPGLQITSLQASIDVEPASLVSWPGGHSLQSDKAAPPVLLRNVFLGQSFGSIDPAGLYVPGGLIDWVEEVLPAGQKYPAEHFPVG